MATAMLTSRDVPCADDPDLFTEDIRANGRKAKDVCFDVCSVREQCLEFALACEVTDDGVPLPAKYRGGVYGGLGPGERHAEAWERINLAQSVRNTIVTLTGSEDASSQARFSA